MRRFSVNEAVPPVDRVVGPRVRPLGGLEVNRVWPTAKRRLVGPFIFFDHMFRTVLAPGVGLDVPPHPHIGLATVTYLFEGEIQHADSLGCRQVIRPGEINWMTAGRGITHSERTTDADRGRESVVHGVQTWVALPRELEDCEPAFAHYGAEALPELDVGGIRLRVLAGAAFGVKSRVEPGFDLFYVEALGRAASTLTLPADLGQRALYVVDGSVDVGAGRYDAGRALVFEDGDDIEVVLARDSHLMLFGGQPIGGDRHIYWNFVSSRPAAIVRARADWETRRFPPVPGDDDYMPIPA